MEGLTLRCAQAPLPHQREEEVEAEEEVEVEEEVEEEVEAEEEALEEHPLNPPTKGTSGNKEHYPRNSKEIAPKPKNSLKICEATFA